MKVRCFSGAFDINIIAPKGSRFDMERLSKIPWVKKAQHNGGEAISSAYQ
jgi:hypothetical protein